jgi:phenylacetate-CoA ligase
MKAMEKIQWLSLDEIKDYQWHKLQQLILHAAKTVPYYQNIFAEINLDPENFSLDDFRRIPIMEKEIFKENERDVISSDYKNKLIRLRTGSSTGTPMWFYSCKHTQAFQNAAKLRCRKWWGIEPGDMMFEFWASPIELSKRGQVTVFKDQLLMNHYMLSALNMTPEVMTDYIVLMNKKKPRVIVGYPSAMQMLAQHLQQTRGLQLEFEPKGIVVTAEVLLPSQRQLIQEVFNAPVINEYGARDGGLLAYECPEGSMHIVSENVFIEIDEQSAISGNLLSGDVLVTNLESFAYPFLRYRVGDQVTLSDKQCKCGRGLPCLEHIEGRKTDWLTDTTGKKIHGLVVAHTIGKVQGIRQFQIIQTQPDKIVIKVAKNSLYKESDDEFITNSLQKYFSGPMSIELEHVERISAPVSGKHRFIINEVET